MQPIKTLLTTALLTLAFALPSLAQNDAAPAGEDVSPAFEQLQRIVELAPSREIGQPGNEAVDNLVQDWFETAVAEQNDPARAEAVSQAWSNADQATHAWVEAADTAQAPINEERIIRSSTVVAYTLEKPWLVTIAMIGLLVMLYASWRVQEREGLKLAALITVIAGIALNVTAALVVTDVEQINRDMKLSSDRSAFERRVDSLTRKIDDNLTPRIQTWQNRVDAAAAALEQATEQNKAERQSAYAQAQNRVRRFQSELRQDREELERYQTRLSAVTERIDARLADARASLQALPERPDSGRYEDPELRERHRYLTARVDALEGGAARTTAGLELQRNAHLVEAIERDLEAAAASRGLWQHGRIVFPAAAFNPADTTLSIDGGESIELHQITPNLINPANLRNGALSGPMVYVGTATDADLATVDLDGAVALVEFASLRRWIALAERGASAIIFVETPAEVGISSVQAIEKVTPTPLSLPRFFVERDRLTGALGEDWQQALRNPTPIEITQPTPGKWSRETLAVDWLYIPPAPGTFTSDDSLHDSLVHIQAYKDAASVVPTRSPGAQSAAGLVAVKQLLDRFRQTPPKRPVLISVVNGHANAQLGEQQFAHYAFAPPGMIFKQLTSLTEMLAEQKLIAKTYRPGPEHMVEGEDGEKQRLVESLRFATVRVGGKVYTLKKPVVERLRTKRNEATSRRGEAYGKLQIAEEQGASEATLQELQAEVDKHQEEADSYIPLMQLFNKFGQQTGFSDLSAEQQEQVRRIFAQVADEADRLGDAITQQREMILQSLQVRRRLQTLSNATEVDVTSADNYGDIFARQFPEVGAVAMFTFDFSFGNDQIGMFFEDARYQFGAQRKTDQERVARLAAHVLRIADETIHAEDDGGRPLLVDTVLNAGQPWAMFMARDFTVPARAAQFTGQPALTLATTNDSRKWSFTPHDTPDRIDRRHFDRIMTASTELLSEVIDQPGLEAAFNRRRGSAPKSVETTVRKRDKFTMGLPEQRLVNAAVTITPQNNPDFMFGQVRTTQTHVTDLRGTAHVVGGVWANGSMLAFGFGPDHRQITESLDFGESEADYGSNFDQKFNVHQERNVLAFSSRKVDLYGLTAPLTLQPLNAIIVLDAAHNSQPLHFSTAGIIEQTRGKAIPSAQDGTGSVFVEPDMRFKLSLAGSPVINVSPDELDEERVEGQGFSPDADRLSDLTISGAQDMMLLNVARLNKLRERGVKNDTATELNDKAVETYPPDEKAGAIAKSQLRAEEARGLAYKSYGMAVGTLNDLIKAVVVFLGLVIPFCFFVMKLISPYTDINRQLAIFGLIFVVMVVLLQLVHPAFAVAETPQVVVLAFVIMGLAVFVGSVVVTRFNASMSQAVEEVQMSDNIDAPQGRLAGVAFMVGVNNMKRRRIRTTLTAVTIVLVTFTTLSVMSVGQGVDPTRRNLGGQAQYDGFVFTRPGMSAIDPVQSKKLSNHFEDHALVNHRIWVQEQGDNGNYIPFSLLPEVDLPGQQAPSFEARVLLGLAPTEDGFITDMPMAAGRFFKDGDAQEVILSVEGAASVFGLTPDNFKPIPIRLNGKTLTLVGLIEDKAMSDLRDTGDVPVLPLLVQGSQDAAAMGAQQDQAAQQEMLGTASLDAGGDLMSQPGVEVAEPRQIAIVPADFAIEMDGATVRAISVKYTGDDAEGPGASQRAWDEVHRLIGFQHVRVMLGLTDPVKMEDESTLRPGQYALAASSSTELGGVLKIAIPVALGATIIFNTMLGSVVERRREIGIYNAIGLNPTHVIVFFLAESLVFGLVGSVAGYLIGQILSVIIARLELIDLNLNYSSLSVIFVIFITMVTVLLSALYPAFMAARAAVPSGQRKWSMPAPKDDQIHLTFPFVYDPSRVLGALAYMYDFMRLHTEASTGNFLADLGPHGYVPGEEGLPSKSEPDPAVDHRVYALTFDVAPAPFDLGVNQAMEVYAFFNPRVGAYMLSVYLTRVSGERGNWMTVNQPFLETLRKRMLGWRSQKSETQQAFYEQGVELFDNAPNLPVDTKAGEGT